MRILILGSLPKNDIDNELYQAIIQVCEKFAEEVSSPIDTANFHGTPTEVYERAFQKVREADLVIGEQSQPSTGQGMELRECANLNKPVIVVAKEGSKVSGLMKGCPVVREILYYTDPADLQEKLISTLQNQKNNLQ